MARGPKVSQSSDPLRRLVESRGWTSVQAGNALHLSDSAIRDYLKKGWMPGVVGLAVESLRGKLDQTDVLVLVGPQEDLNKVRAVAKSMGLRAASLSE